MTGVQTCALPISPVEPATHTGVRRIEHADRAKQTRRRTHTHTHTHSHTHTLTTSVSPGHTHPNTHTERPQDFHTHAVCDELIVYLHFSSPVTQTHTNTHTNTRTHTRGYLHREGVGGSREAAQVGCTHLLYTADGTHTHTCSRGEREREREREIGRAHV